MLLHIYFCDGCFIQMLKDSKNLLKMSLKILFIKKKGISFHSSPSSHSAHGHFFFPRPSTAASAPAHPFPLGPASRQQPSRGSCLVRRGWAGTVRAAGLARLGRAGKGGGELGCWLRCWAAGRKKREGPAGRMWGREEWKEFSLFLFINKIFKLIFKRFLESFSIWIKHPSQN